MTPEELYQMSLGRTYEQGNCRVMTSDGSYLHPSGLSIKLFNSLARSDLVMRDDSGRALAVDWPKVIEAVKSGEIWGCPMIGEKSVRALCDVIIEKFGDALG
jgi:hypothetical protein